MSENTRPEPSIATPAYLITVALVCVGAIGLTVLMDVLFFSQDASFKREGGGLETISALLYVVAFAAFFIHAPRHVWSALFHIPALMALFAMREWDMDKAFTQSGILSIKFYSGDSALKAKLIGGAIALFAVWVILRTAWRGIPVAWAALRQGWVWPWFAVFAGVLVVASKSVDGLGRKMLDFGIVISEDMDQAASVAEEVAEAFIPVCAILAILARWKGRNT